MTNLVFQTEMMMKLGPTSFVNTPVILQYDDTPLIEMVRQVGAGYRTRFSIFHNDGTKIAVADGSRIFKTAEGEKAKIEWRYPVGATVLEFEGKPIIEMRRDEAAALRTYAELHAPGGVFTRSTATSLNGLEAIFNLRTICPNVTVTGAIENSPIGYLVTRDMIYIGCGPGGAGAAIAAIRNVDGATEG